MNQVVSHANKNTFQYHAPLQRDGQPGYQQPGYGLTDSDAAQSQNSYTSAAYPPSISAPSPNLQQHHSSAANAHANPPSSQTSFAMAAPPPITQNSQSPGTINTTTSTPKTPLSPTSTPNPTLDQQRITHLLTLNTHLLTEVAHLQTLGQGGATTPAQAAQLKAANQPDTMASDDYIQTLRRVQANIAYMMPRASQQTGSSDNNAAAAAAAAGAKLTQGPAFMTPPPHMRDGEVGEGYERLRELFPDWVGHDQMRMSGGGSQGSPRPGMPLPQQQQSQNSSTANGMQQQVS